MGYLYHSYAKLPEGIGAYTNQYFGGILQSIFLGKSCSQPSSFWEDDTGFEHYSNERIEGETSANKEIQHNSAAKMKEFENTYGDCVGIENWKVPQTIGIGSPKYGNSYSATVFMFFFGHQKSDFFQQKPFFFSWENSRGRIHQGIQGDKNDKTLEKIDRTRRNLGDFM